MGTRDVIEMVGLVRGEVGDTMELMLDPNNGYDCPRLLRFAELPAQTFVKQIDIDEFATTSMVFSDAQLTTIHQMMTEIDIWGYPETFRVPVAEGKVFTEDEHAAKYRLTVRNGQSTKTVEWTDNRYLPTNAEADRLRELFDLIGEVTAQQPEYEQLPERRILCI